MTKVGKFYFCNVLFHAIFAQLFYLVLLQPKISRPVFNDDFHHELILEASKLATADISAEVQRGRMLILFFMSVIMMVKNRYLNYPTAAVLDFVSNDKSLLQYFNIFTGPLQGELQEKNRINKPLARLES